MLKVNEYFDGNVKSIAFNTATLPATIGVMAPGDYVFNTADREAVTVINGAMTVRLPGETLARTIQAGESFNVAANSAFDVSIVSDTAYLCLYG